VFNNDSILLRVNGRGMKSQRGVWQFLGDCNAKDRRDGAGVTCNNKSFQVLAVVPGKALSPIVG